MVDFNLFCFVSEVLEMQRKIDLINQNIIPILGYFCYIFKIPKDNAGKTKLRHNLVYLNHNPRKICTFKHIFSLKIDSKN